MHMAETLNYIFSVDGVKLMVDGLYRATGVKVELDGQIKID